MKSSIIAKDQALVTIRRQNDTFALLRVIDLSTVGIDGKEDGTNVVVSNKAILGLKIEKGSWTLMTWSELQPVWYQCVIL
jgi:hypothetical protein